MRRRQSRQTGGIEVCGFTSRRKADVRYMVRLVRIEPPLLTCECKPYKQRPSLSVYGNTDDQFYCQHIRKCRDLGLITEAAERMRREQMDEQARAEFERQQWMAKIDAVAPVLDLLNLTAAASGFQTYAFQNAAQLRQTTPRAYGPLMAFAEQLQNYLWKDGKPIGTVYQMATQVAQQTNERGVRWIELDDG
jgi:hypothetical protein